MQIETFYHRKQCKWLRQNLSPDGMETPATFDTGYLGVDTGYPDTGYLPCATHTK